MNKNLAIICFLLVLFNSGITHANDVVQEFAFEPNKIYPVNTSLTFRGCYANRTQSARNY